MSSLVGWYGKIPSYGDYITANLPSTFVAQWSRWTGAMLFSAQRALGSEWPKTFLTAPPCRFLLPPELIDERLWTGVMVPSGDAVGRLYPLCCAIAMEDQGHGRCQLLPAASWYDSISRVMAEAIARASTGEDLHSTLLKVTYHQEVSVSENGSAVLFPGEKAHVYDYPYWERALGAARFDFSAPSVWWYSTPQNLVSGLACYGWPNAAQYLGLLRAGVPLETDDTRE